MCACECECVLLILGGGGGVHKHVRLFMLFNFHGKELYVEGKSTKSSDSSHTQLMHRSELFSYFLS